MWPEWRYCTWRPIYGIRTCLIMSRTFLLRMRNVAYKSFRGNQSTHFVFNNFLLENRACKLLENFCTPVHTHTNTHKHTHKHTNTNTNTHTNTHTHTRTHTYKHTHFVGLLWMRDRPVAEACTCTTHDILKRKAAISSAGFELQS